MDTEIAGHGLYFPLDSSEQFSLHCVLTRERANNLFMPSSWWTGFVINSVLGVEDQFVISSADWGRKFSTSHSYRKVDVCLEGL